MQLTKDIYAHFLVIDYGRNLALFRSVRFFCMLHITILPFYYDTTPPLHMVSDSCLIYLLTIYIAVQSISNWKHFPIVDVLYIYRTFNTC